MAILLPTYSDFQSKGTIRHFAPTQRVIIYEAFRGNNLIFNDQLVATAPEAGCNTDNYFNHLYKILFQMVGLGEMKQYIAALDQKDQSILLFYFEGILETLRIDLKNSLN